MYANLAKCCILIQAIQNRQLLKNAGNILKYRNEEQKHQYAVEQSTSLAANRKAKCLNVWSKRKKEEKSLGIDERNIVM